MYDLLRKSHRTAKFGLAMIIVLLFWAFLFNQGCATKNTSPQNQLITMYDMYNGQYASYMMTTGYVMEEGQWVKKRIPNLSEEQRKILREKKKILNKIYPLIQMYDSLVKSGGVIPPSLQMQIMSLLDSLILSTL